jgi:prolipoprotein diacylglyceryl transferase
VRAFTTLLQHRKYFNRNFLDAVKIWEGGLGIWGAILGGAIGAYFALIKFGKRGEFLVLADALAPGLLLAQALGRFGNWFNGELFGRPTSLPWGLEIPIDKRPLGFENFATFHPTLLYEALWSIFIAFILLRLKRKKGQTFWLYVMLYSLGRAGIELLRTDYSHFIFGLRLNVWISLLCISLGAWQYLKIQRQQVG